MNKVTLPHEPAACSHGPPEPCEFLLLDAKEQLLAHMAQGGKLLRNRLAVTSAEAYHFTPPWKN